MVKTDVIDLCIEIMEQASKFKTLNMIHWYSVPDEDNPKDWMNGEPDVPTQTPEQIHACGNRACFAGHLAVNPEFRQLVGLETEQQSIYPTALCEMLGIPLVEATGLIFGDMHVGRGLDEGDHSPYYDKPWCEVTPEDVISQLTRIKEEYSDAV